MNKTITHLNFEFYLYVYCFKRKISQEPQPFIKCLMAIQLSFSPQEKRLGSLKARLISFILILQIFASEFGYFGISLNRYFKFLLNI